MRILHHHKISPKKEEEEQELKKYPKVQETANIASKCTSTLPNSPETLKKRDRSKSIN